MVYTSAISLNHTIERLLNSGYISLVQNSSQQFIRFLYEEVGSMQEALKELDTNRKSINRKRVNAFDEQIRVAICEFDDVLESNVSNQIHSQSQRIHPFLFSIDLQELDQDIDSFTQTLKMMKADYIHELLCNPSAEDKEEDGDHVVPSRIDQKMVGLSDQYMKIKEQLTRTHLSLFGMAGIGKTTLAWKLFQDSVSSSVYSRHAFVTLGPKYQLESIWLDILKQVTPDFDGKLLTGGEESLADALKRMVCDSLKDWRFLIVLDDVWDPSFKDDFISLFSMWSNGSRVLVTTRLQTVAQATGRFYGMGFLDKNESWDLLRDKVFGEGSPCPPRLVKAGKKIAEHCEGLPLTIVTVADILSKAHKTPEYWNEIARDKQNSVFTDAYGRMYEVLYPSYDYLPQHLKPCFLYMGVFPQNYEITRSKLITLWIAEGFSERVGCMSSEDFAQEYLQDISFHSVLMPHEESFANDIKTCSLHSTFWYLCNKEAGTNKFFHSLNRLADGLAEESLKSQRRLSVRNSVLFAIKDVHDSMASTSAVRSLLCTGPYHQYPVSICFRLRLLRVLDALKIRLYDFPMEVLDLALLTYLALTFHGKLPASISKLWNLQFLIVHRHMSIVESDQSSSYLPIEIWDMKELKHLQVIRSDLPVPHEGSLLPNLLTLLNVSAKSCTKDILERVPNLHKLGIRIELAPDDDQPLCLFDHISNLDELHTLKCVIVYPRITRPTTPLSIFSASLEKLTLSGFGYAWEEMSKISSLPNLKQLKLQCCAFRGPKWEVHAFEFQQLRFLLVEDSDLVHWTFRNPMGCLRSLEWLTIKHCYKLQEIPLGFGGDLERVELVDCNPLALDRAKQLKKSWDRRSRYGKPLDLRIHSSWDDVNIKT